MGQKRKRPDTIVYTVSTNEETCSITLRRNVATWAGFGYSLPGYGRVWTPEEVEKATDPLDVLAREKATRESFLREAQERHARLHTMYTRLLVRFHDAPRDDRDAESILQRARYDVEGAARDLAREQTLVTFLDSLLAACGRS